MHGLFTRGPSGFRALPGRALKGITAAVALVSSLHTVSVQANPVAVVNSDHAVLSEKAASSLLLDITRAGDSQRLVAVGDRGHILISDNNGYDWRQVSVPSRQMLTAVSFPTDTTGFAVGHDAVILKSTDDGENWTKVYDDLDAEVPLLDIMMMDEETGFAVGAYGYIVRTKDGGETWDDWFDMIENEDEFHYNAITQIGDGTLLLAGEAGLLHRSLDSGETWELLESPYEGSFFGIIPGSNPGAAIVFGLRGNAFETVDAGESWVEVDTGTDQTLFGAVHIDGNGQVIVGSSGTLFEMSGPEPQVHTRSDRATLLSASEAPDNSLVVVGETGVHRMPVGKSAVATLSEQ